MSKTPKLRIDARLDTETALLIDAIHNIMSSFSVGKLDEVSRLLKLNDMPATLADTHPLEVCKYAAIVGLKLVSQIAEQKAKMLSDIAASN